MLYFDIGNTCIKIMHSECEKIDFLATKNFDEDELEAILNKYKYSKVVICSVVPEATKIVKAILAKRGDEVKDLNWTDFRLKLNVEAPEKVGVDLLALATYVDSQVEEGIIVNFGTATTITYVANKTFKGTIILPGIMMQKNCFQGITSKIGKIEFVDNPKIVGGSTNEAITIGILQGQQEAVKGLVKKIADNAKVFCSGGNAMLLNDLPIDWVKVEQATLQGVKLIAKTLK